MAGRPVATKKKRKRKEKKEEDEPPPSLFLEKRLASRINTLRRNVVRAFPKCTVTGRSSFVVRHVIGVIPREEGQ